VWKKHDNNKPLARAVIALGTYKLMNKKVIYTISAGAMLVVAISVGFIFSQPVPPTITAISQNTSPSLEKNTQNSTAQALQPIEDLIAQSAQGKPIPNKDALEKNKKVTWSNSLENLTFSAEGTNTANDTANIAKQKTNAVEKTPATKESMSQEKTTLEKAKQAKKKNVLITKSNLQPKTGVATITNTELSMDGDQVKFLVKGNQKVEAKSFILKKPNRIVFDIKGTWAIAIPRLISNRMVKDIRLGATDTHTRLVFDLKVKPNKTQVKKINQNETQLIFR